MSPFGAYHRRRHAYAVLSPKRGQPASAARGDDGAPAWPVDRAFVLRFAAGADPAGGLVAGRIEHVVAGRGRPFSTYDEMLAFIARTLEQRRTCGA